MEIIKNIRFLRQIITQFLILILLLFSQITRSQLGCTDPNANNFNASATQNNGSCTYNVTTQTVSEIGFLTPLATESSGIIYDLGFIWTHNDSGNSNDFFKINPDNGSVLQTIAITNFPNNDWEDITFDADYFYIGDFGNNNGNRTNLKVLRIAKSQFVNNTSTNISVTAESINFSYSDQTNFSNNSNTNFDCESIISVGNFLYLFSKNRGNLQTRVYKLSKIPGTYVVNSYTTFDANGLITGADYNTATHEVALIGYMSDKKNSFLYYLNDFNSDLFFSGNVRRIEIGNSINDWQTEGIAYKNNNQIYISCETSNYTDAKLYLTNKSSMVLDVAHFDSENILKIFPNPSEDLFNIKNSETIKNIEVVSIEGKTMFQKNIGSKNFELQKSDFTSSNGCFILKIETDKEKIYRKLIVK